MSTTSPRRTRRAPRWRLALPVVGALVASLLAACSSSGSGGASSSSKTVTVWSGTKAEQKAMKQIFAEYNATNKDSITVKFRLISGGDYGNQLAIALRTNQGPDVFRANTATTLIKGNYLLPLENALDATTKQDYRGYLQIPGSVARNGHTYAVPMSVSTLKLAYNKDLFAKAGLDPNKPPTTFSEVLADSKAITEKVHGAYGFGVPLAWNPGFAYWGVDAMMVDASKNLTQRGLYDVDTKRVEAEKYAPAVALFRTLIDKKWAYPGAASLDADPLRAAFAQGKVGMYMSAAFDVASIDSVLKSKIHWAAADLPVPDGMTHEQTIAPLGAIWAVNAHTKSKAAALKVLELMASKSSQTTLAQAGVYFPLNRQLSGASIGPADQPQYAEFAFDPAKDTIAPSTPTDDIELQGTDYYQTLVKLISGNGNVDSALSDVSKKYNAAIQRAVSAKQINLDDYGYPSIQK